MPGAELPRSADVTRAFGSCYWETFGEVAAIAGQKVGISRLEVPCTTAARLSEQPIHRRVLTQLSTDKGV